MTTPVFSANAQQSGVPPKGWNLNGFEFDAWLKLNHNTSLTITQHPVESGAEITDHSYINQKRFSFDIGMTDCVVSPNVPGTQSRSINAYNFLLDMQEARTLLTLDCKYANYGNILIESIDVSDDWQTKNTLKATINLIQIFLVDTKLIKRSTNQQATAQTNRGKVSTAPALGSWDLVVKKWNELWAPL